MTSVKQTFALTNKPKHQPGSGVNCAALVVAAPHSGSGKTTVTAALARFHRNQGKKVTVFKVGPDFIDPMILRQASGELVYQLDLWLVGEQGCQDLLYQAAQHSDLILIEGVMGLFDGTPSSADLACYFDIPVLGIIDAKAMAQTFAAVAFGLANFCPQLPFAGVLANRVNSERHAELVQQDLPPDIRFFGRFPKEQAISLPERHLGLVQAQELSDIDQQLQQAASYVANTQLTQLPAEVEFFAREINDQHSLLKNALSDIRVIVIRDPAFSFIYAANIAFLEQAGAELLYCSALTANELPDGDVLYIPGGYPELYAEQLVENVSFMVSVRRFAASNKRIIAECGGMLYLLEQLTDLSGNSFDMLGLLPGKAQMQNKLAAIGSQWVELPLAECAGNTIIRGHSFHYSSAEIELVPLCQTRHYPSERLGEYVYLQQNILASYMHWYFPSNPALALQLFDNKPLMA